MDKEKYSLDIMGRKLCSPIMPCGVCRVFNKSLDSYPKGYFRTDGEVVSI